MTRRLLHHSYTKTFKPLYENSIAVTKYKIVVTTTALYVRDNLGVTASQLGTLMCCVLTTCSQLVIVSVKRGDFRLQREESAWNSFEEREKDDCTLRPLRVRMPFTISSSLLPFSSGEPFMVSQWSNTDWGNACPPVAWRRSPLKPKDSMTGRYAFTVNIGVPIRCSSENTCPRRLFNTE